MDLKQEINNQIKEFEKEFNYLNIDVSLFDTDNGKDITEHFLIHYTGISFMLIKNKTFINTVYPYIELSFRDGFDLDKVYGIIAQDLQTT